MGEILELNPTNSEKITLKKCLKKEHHDEICNRCAKLGHLETECRACYYCNDVIHPEEKCRKKLQKMNESKDNICKRCAKLGHLETECVACY